MKCLHCRSKVKAAGLCGAHYFRARAGHPVDGKPRASRKQEAKPCWEPGCLRPARAKGLCATHYAALVRRPRPLWPLIDPMLRGDEPGQPPTDYAREIGRDMLDAAVVGKTKIEAVNHVLARFIARHQPKEKT